METKWVQIWGQAHSSLSYFYYPSDKKTYRFIINSAIDGTGIQVELSNEYGKEDVYIGEMTVAVCNENGTFISCPENLTIGGNTSVKLKTGEVLKTDELPFAVKTDDYIAISIYVEKGALRSGNLLDNTVLLTVKGNETATKSIINERRKRDTVIDVAGKVLNLFLHKPLPLIQSVQVKNNTDAASVIVFGDSLSQQGFWTNRFEERLREAYPGKYSVINKSVMGNRVLRDFSSRFPCKGLFGISAQNRIHRDVLSYADCRYAVIAIGTNDFIQYGTIAAPKKEKPAAQDVFEGVKAMCKMMHEAGIKPIVINIPACGECIDSRPEKEKMAEEYNRLLRENRHLFHAVIDQRSLLINPDKPYCTKKEFLGKDKLHFNAFGGKTVADSIDMKLFE